MASNQELDSVHAAVSCEQQVEVRQFSGSAETTTDCIAREVPVALVYNGIAHAVMMATPADLEDFALGFSISEGILLHADELYGTSTSSNPAGITIELEISAQRQAALRERRRNLAGRTGCGLCGIESLAQAIPPVASVKAPSLSESAIQLALAQLPSLQPLQTATGASHAAAWCDLLGNIVLLREDVGRHNALDKLVGALLLAQLAVAEGFVLISSRASYEMVQKSCGAGIGALVAVSAPTSLAIEQARRAGQLLVGFARPGRHVIYHDPHADATPPGCREARG